MYIYRAEHLKEPGYILKARNRHKEINQFELEYYMKELETAKQEREQIINNSKKEIENYNLIFNKPVSELSKQEKEIIMENFKIFGVGFNKNKKIDYTNIDIDLARATMQPFYKFPLRDVEWNINYYTEEIDYLKNKAENTFCIGLNCNNITRENIDSLKKYLSEIKNIATDIRIGIDGDMRNKDNSSKVDYVYSKEEIQLLNELSIFLHDNNIEPLKICEMKELKTLDDFNSGWTLNEINEANNKIDRYVNFIKEQNFSPFETILYVHKILSTFKYKDSGKIEEARVLPSILNSDKIVCAGYATLFKAIIDKLDIPELTCDIIGCKIISKHSIGGHAHNIINIKDPKYGIDGIYVEDVCWDSKDEKHEKGRGFAHCLYPIGDLENFSNGIKYYNSDSKDRFSNLLIDTDELTEDLKHKKEGKLSYMIYNIKKHLEYKKTPSLVKLYEDISPSIPLETYKQGLTSIYSKLYDTPEKVDKLVQQQIYYSQINGINNFNEKASNSFTSSINKKQRKQMAKKAKGPSTIQ